MKWLLFVFAGMVLTGHCSLVSAQVKIGGDPTTPVTTGAVLELDGASGGLLLPKVDVLPASGSVAEGMIYYLTTDGKVYINHAATGGWEFNHGNERENKIIQKLVSSPEYITGSGTTGAKNYQTVETYMERFEMSACFTLTSGTLSTWIGKGYAGLKLKSTGIEIYALNSSLNGSALVETIPLPFAITPGETYSIGFKKFANGVKYFASSQGILFEKEYNKTTNNRASIMWGAGFFGVESGTISLETLTTSSDYTPKAKLYITGDSFIEGASMVAYGLENRWCALLASAIGNNDVVINGKGGEAINSAYINRYKTEITWYNPKYVFVSLGTNNISNVTAYKTYMQQLIDQIKSEGRIPILVTCTPRPEADYTTTVKVINDFVKASGEFYVDMNKAVTVSGDPSTWKSGYVQADNVHPSLLGHEAMFNQIKTDCPFLFQL
ncbi:hypothetical protein AGMMS49525_02450 [Bacteroidia bacterium]|nr:hypothetical protein AGMMS49525_02450 [Bacteroidia bacterium]